MRYYWDFLKHFLTSNSRHGTHSPFVYGLADQVIYRHIHMTTLKTSVPDGFAPVYFPLLQDMLAYLSIEELVTFDADTDAPSLLVLDLKSVSTDDIMMTLRTGKTIIVHEPFKTRQSKRIWEKLIQETAVVVSIDLFHFGLLFYREGQQKENFKLRYPFWR